MSVFFMNFLILTYSNRSRYIHFGVIRVSDIRYRYLQATVVCSTACLFCVYQFMLQSAPSLMVPELIEGLNLDLADIGLLTSSLLYVYLCFQVPGGYAADHINARYLLPVSGILMATACYWFSHASSMTEACLARGLMGAATSPAMVVCMNLASRWYPDRWFSGMSGLVEAFAMTGGALGPLILPQIIADYGWRTSMDYVALTGLLLAVISGLLVRDRPPNINHAELELKPLEAAKSASHFSRSQFIWLCLFGFGMFGLLTSFGGLWAISFLEVEFPGREAEVADKVSLIFIGAACGAPVFGLIASWLNKVRLIMLMSVVVTTLLTGLLVLADFSLGIKGVLCFLAGFFCGGYVLVFTLAREMGKPSSQGTVLAIANGTMILSGPILQPLIGFILDARQADRAVLTLYDFQIAMVPLFLVQCIALIAIIALLRVRQ